VQYREKEKGKRKVERGKWKKERGATYRISLSSFLFPLS
jgi:hypothetical protein